MLLKNILKSIAHKEIIAKNLDKNIIHASSDSRLIFPGSIFVARKGSQFNGLEFVPRIKDKVECVLVLSSEKKAVLRLSKRLTDIAFVLVDDIETTSCQLAKLLFKGIENLNIIGVTGTNGKTTTSFLINRILNDLHKPSALLGTIRYKWDETKLASFLTTPDNFTLKSILYKMYKDNIKYVVAEISSHGLAQDRLKGLYLLGAIFMNLSRDHLDYHKTLRDYFQAKLKIFKYLKKGSKALINIDDSYGYAAYRQLKAHKLSFGIKKDAIYRVSSYRFEKNAVEFLITIRGKKYFVKAPILGVCNIYNALASIACCDSLSLPLDKVISSISQCKPPPGRLEEVRKEIFIDYAHTHSALREAIMALRQSGFDKIIVVFGCGGDRDKTKRPKMGAVASNYADYCIVTSDNPRSEDPHKICQEIKKGIKKKNYEIITDRKKAIRKALHLKKNSTFAVLIAGKGHERYQIFKDKSVSFSDNRIVRELLSSKSKA